MDRMDSEQWTLVIMRCTVYPPASRFASGETTLRIPIGNIKGVYSTIIEYTIA